MVRVSRIQKEEAHPGWQGAKDLSFLRPWQAQLCGKVIVTLVPRPFSEVTAIVP